MQANQKKKIEMPISDDDIRAILYTAIQRTKKILTGLLHEKKEEIREKLRVYLARKRTIPQTLSRLSDFYKTNIGTRKFKSILRTYRDDRSDPNVRAAMRSPIGKEIIRRIIRNRLWEFVRGRLRAMEMVFPITSANLDSEEETMEDAEPITASQREHNEPRNNAKPRVTTTHRYDTRNNPAKPANSNDTTVTTSNNTNAMSAGNNTNVLPNASLSTFPEALNQLVSEETAKDFSLNISELDLLSMEPSDKYFFSQATHSIKSLLQSLKSKMYSAGNVLKAQLIMSFATRKKYMVKANKPYFWSVVAPYLDPQVRPYVALLDLSMENEKVMAVQLAKKRFHVFLCVLAFLSFGIDPTETSKAIAGVTPNKKVRTIAEIKAAITSLPWSTIENSSIKLVQHLAVIFDCVTIPNFTIASHVSGLIEKKQPSLTSFDAAMMHLAINSMCKDPMHNASYEGTLELFKAIVFTDRLTVIQSVQAIDYYNQCMRQIPLGH